jgi:phosphoesterase RecJ-like protein
MEAKIKQLVDDAQHIVVVQADNPDADSLGSALALEQILGDQGKQVSLYCGVDMPGYLKYLTGWSRVSKELPANFDLSIIVDASTVSLLGELANNGGLDKLANKPCAVLDHHANVQNPIEFANASLVDGQISSTGELIFSLAKQLGWPLDQTSGEAIMTAILGDTQGLSNDLARAATYRVMADLTELGVDRVSLEEQRRAFSKMAPAIYKYKAELIRRSELSDEGRIIDVVIPQSEIHEFSPLYNPAALVQFDMLQVSGVQLAIVFKKYDSGRVTAAIRSNREAPIAGQLAEAMGGGGHNYASGFKVEDGRPFNEIKSECLQLARNLLNKLEQDQTDETV